ncbi:MAG: ATP-binding protein [Deltaproteobacteria bacterium]
MPKPGHLPDLDFLFPYSSRKEIVPSQAHPMKKAAKTIERELYHKLKLLMFFRIIFTSILLGSTIIIQLNENTPPLAKPLLLLYGLILGIFVLSFAYALLLARIKNEKLFATIQISVDTVVVTLIIFVTGCFLSFFSFLYLVVIIYSSVLLFSKGSMIMAGFCSLQYAAMLGLEYFGMLKPFGMDSSVMLYGYDWTRVLYKVALTALACYAVAFLSGFLSEQTRQTKKELQAMEAHVKQVEKMALLGEMAAGLAHEIKNPLASLSGSIQILREEINYDPEMDNLMRIVMRETDRLATLVSDFLLFAKPPSPKLENFQLAEALEETLEFFKKDSSNLGRIAIEYHSPQGIWVTMDPIHLRQIMLNLLLNGAEAIEGEGRISVEVRAVKNREVIISITDNGAGIPAERIDSIFDPFYTNKRNGTGLGLSIVHRILSYYDSRIEVESMPGKGTVFRFRLKTISPPQR